VDDNSPDEADRQDGRANQNQQKRVLGSLGTPMKHDGSNDLVMPRLGVAIPYRPEPTKAKKASTHPLAQCFPQQHPYKSGFGTVALVRGPNVHKPFSGGLSPSQEPERKNQIAEPCAEKDYQECF
jgi:hypothetical protein